jgi:hypothetical protein
LTEPEIAAVLAAAPAPPAPAQATHIAGCPSCQDRLLAHGRTTPKVTERPQGLTRWRLAILSGALLLMGLVALWSIWRVVAAGE